MLHNEWSISILLIVYKLIITVKRHSYACEKFMQICQNGPLDKFMRFLFMRSSTLCIVTYGAIKIYAVQIYATCA